MSTDHKRQLNSEAFAEVIQQFESLQGLILTLSADINRYRAANDGTGRRALVRAAFAYVEGTSFGFRYAAINLARLRDVQLTVGETLMANEITYVLNEKGQVEEKLAISSPLANVRFALTIFAKAVDVPYEFPASDSKFENLQRAQRIRNRLAHPRSDQELDVSADEQDLVTSAVDWIAEQQTKLMKAIAFRMHSGLQRFYESVQALSKVEGGGYKVEEVERIFSRELTDSNPISFEEVSKWFSVYLK
jgi:hypothetical protein